MIDRDTLSAAEKIIYDCHYDGLSQSDISNERNLEMMFDAIRNKRAYALHRNGVVVVLFPEGKWVARLHVYSSNKKTSWIRNGFKIMEFVFTNSDFQYIWGYSSNPKFLKQVQRGGWKHVGVFEKSYWDGEKFIDQYVYGTTKQDYLDFLNKINNL